MHDENMDKSLSERLGLSGEKPAKKKAAPKPSKEKSPAKSPKKGGKKKGEISRGAGALRSIWV